MSAPNEFHTERLKGGGFNRIIGITINANTHLEERVVLRVPRFNDAHPDREVAVINFVRQHPRIPVTEIKVCDFTPDNPLGSPYVIQHRIPGNDMQSKDHSFLTLSQKQQCTFANEFGRILRSIQGIKSPTPSRIEAAPKHRSTQKFTVPPLEVVQKSWDGTPETKVKSVPDQASHDITAPDYKSTLDFLVSQLDRWKALRTDPEDLIRIYMDRLVIVTYQMEKMGYLGDDEYPLCHLDLNHAPRNVMVHIRPDNSAVISRILHWDSAIFAPKYVSCTPPM